MTDTVKAAGQHMEQEAAHELVGPQRHRLVTGPSRSPVVLPAEGDAPFVQRDEPLVRDRHPVRVAGQIGQHCRRPGKRALGIDHPFTLVQRLHPRSEGRRVGEPGLVAEETQLPGAMGFVEFFKVAQPEQAREYQYRQEEAFPTGHPLRPVGRQPATGHDAVHVGMMGQRRTPGVQDQRRTDLRAQMLRVGGDPAPGGVPLALRAMPVTAVVVSDLDLPATLAAQHMSAQHRTAALFDGQHDLELAFTQGGTRPPGRPMGAEDVRDLQGRMPHGSCLHRLQALQLTDHFAQQVGGDLSVERGGLQLLVPEQHLDGPDIDLLFQQMGGETVPQGVHRHPLVDLGELGGSVDGPVELPCAERLDRVQPRKQRAAVEHLALGASDFPPDACASGRRGGAVASGRGLPR